MNILLVCSLLIVGVSCESKEWMDSMQTRHQMDQAFFGIVGHKPVCSIRCPDGTVCKNGVCSPIFTHSSSSSRSLFAQKLCSTGADCGSEAFCEDGKCVVNNGNGGKCSVGAHCPNGYTCVNARCVQSHHCFHPNCPYYCPDDTHCENGQCVSNYPYPSSHRSFFAQKLCSTGADCGSEAFCEDGKCVVNNGNGGKCSVGAHCPNGYTCVNARCVQSFQHSPLTCPIRCPDGTSCQGGVCLPVMG